MSLSGARGKIGITIRKDGTFAVAEGGAVNTWIAKHQYQHQAQGEAGIEAICQRTASALGIAASRTWSRVIGGEQAVLSERSDRQTDALSGKVEAIHQEDLCQALGWPVEWKYDQGLPREPRWSEAYAVLRAKAEDRTKECDRLTEVLVLAVALGTVDLHRRNIGLRHRLGEGGRAVELAPLYDFSSGVANERWIPFKLALPVAGQRMHRDIGVAQWIEHARQTGQDPHRVIGIATWVLERTPDTLTEAISRARTEDENRDQPSVDRRAQAMQRYAQARLREWTGQVARIAAAGRRKLDETAVGLASAARAIRGKEGIVQATVELGADGEMRLVVETAEGNRRLAGTTKDRRALARALAMVGAGEAGAPVWEHTLEMAQGAA